VNSRVALARTAASGSLVGVVTVNDLSGIDPFAGKDLRAALSQASKVMHAIIAACAYLPRCAQRLQSLYSRVVTAVSPLCETRASQRTASLYPGIAGPTLLVNLPALLGAIVKLFTPLFPKQARHPQGIAEV